MRLEVKIQDLAFENGERVYYYAFYLNDKLLVRLSEYKEYVKLGRQRKFRVEKSYNVYEMRSNNIKLEDIPLNQHKQKLQTELMYQIQKNVRFQYGLHPETNS